LEPPDQDDLSIHIAFIGASFRLDRMKPSTIVEVLPTRQMIERSNKMKLNRFVALMAISLLAIGAMGLISTRTLAKGIASHVQQVQSAQVAQNSPAAEAPDHEAAAGPDTDNIEEQVGQQVEDSQPDGVPAPGASNEASLNQAAPQGMNAEPGAAALSNQANLTFVNAQSAPDAQGGQPEGAETPGTDTGPDEQSPSYASSIAVDQAATEGISEADEAAALAGQAKISLEEAKSAALAANPGTTVVKAELDNENGALVYSVELSNGLDVKVDAGNGAILHTESGSDHEG
jgi:uncharacterized membrane protein YkoI